jgi:hypothetical protein
VVARSTESSPFSRELGEELAPNPRAYAPDLAGHFGPSPINCAVR